MEKLSSVREGQTETPSSENKKVSLDAMHEVGTGGDSDDDVVENEHLPEYATANAAASASGDLLARLREEVRANNTSKVDELCDCDGVDNAMLRQLTEFAWKRNSFEVFGLLAAKGALNEQVDYLVQQRQSSKARDFDEYWMLYCSLLWSDDEDGVSEKIRTLIFRMSMMISSPVVTFNQNKGKVFGTLKSIAANEVYAHRLLLGCTFLWIYFERACRYCRSGEQDLKDYQDRVEGMIREIFNSDSVDSVRYLHRLLLMGTNYSQFYGDDSASPTKYEDTAKEMYEIQALTFGRGNLLYICLKYDLKCVFATTAVSTMIDYLFDNHHTPRTYREAVNDSVNDDDQLQDGNNMTGIAKLSAAAKERLKTVLSDDDAHVFEYFYNILLEKSLFFPRYCPRYMFLLGGVSKLLQLSLIFVVSIEIYGEHQLDCAPISCGGLHSNKYEIWLLVMMCSCILYELGIVFERGVKSYVSSLWNILDIVVYLLMIPWAVLLPFDHHFHLCRIFLALSSIPLCLSLLQYLTNIEDLGVLVIMLFAMIRDISMFIYIYFVFLLGFGMALYSIYFGANGFTSKGGVLLTLFDATLGSYGFGEFDNYPGYSGYGVIILVIFVTLSAILLINLLIAKMSSTYGNIEDKAYEEWRFIKARVLNDYMLNRERNTLCMLPPPFNIITTVLTPVHVYYLHHSHISLCGTIADVVTELLLLCVTCVYSHWKFVRTVYRHGSSRLLTGHPVLFAIVALFIAPVVWGFVMFYIFPVVLYQQVTHLVGILPPQVEQSGGSMILTSTSPQHRHHIPGFGMRSTASDKQFTWHYSIDYGSEVAKQTSKEAPSTENSQPVAKVRRSSASILFAPVQEIVDEVDRGTLFTAADISRIFCQAFPSDLSTEALIEASERKFQSAVSELDKKIVSIREQNETSVKTLIEMKEHMAKLDRKISLLLNSQGQQQPELQNIARHRPQRPPPQVGPQQETEPHILRQHHI